MYCLFTFVIFYVTLFISTRFFSQSQDDNTMICESSSRQTCMDDLPEELFIEVLLRLPVKSLLRFKAVCKAWRSHILNRKFVERHNLRTTANPGNDYFIAHNSCSDYNKFCAINRNSLHKPIGLNLPIAASVSGDECSVVGSCNGLICLDYKRGIGKHTTRRDRITNVYLWNPATGKVKDLRRYSIDISACYDDFCVSLGFGFEVVSGDYKVLRIVRNTKSSVTRVEVYSLKKNSWKEIAVELKYRLWTFVYPAFVKGSLYWDLNERNLVLFDVQNEEFCTILLPPDSWCSKREVFELKESVAFANLLDLRSKNMDIWTLDENSCWIQKWSTRKPFDRGSSIVGYLKTGEYVGSNSYDELVLYDFASEAIKPIEPKMHTLGVYNYSESLVFLN